MYNIVKEWDTDYFVAKVQDWDGVAFLHCEHTVASKASIKHARSLLEGEIKEWLLSNGYDAVYAYTRSDKFVSMFKQFSLIIDDKKADLRIYEWDLS